MTALELFETVGGALPQMIQDNFGRRDLCILATRVIIDVGDYFGVDLHPLQVETVVCNEAASGHFKRGEFDRADWQDQNVAHAVGIGFKANGERSRDRFPGHLIAVSDDAFGDFAIGQAERPERGLVPGPYVFGPRRVNETMWMMRNENSGTYIQYRAVEESPRLFGCPDWRDRHKRKPLVSALVNALNGVKALSL